MVDQRVSLWMAYVGTLGYWIMDATIFLAVRLMSPLVLRLCFFLGEWPCARCSLVVPNANGCNHEKAVTCMWVFAPSTPEVQRESFRVSFISGLKQCVCSELITLGDWNLDVEVLRCRYVF